MRGAEKRTTLGGVEMMYNIKMHTFLSKEFHVVKSDEIWYNTIGSFIGRCVCLGCLRNLGNLA